MTTSLRNVGVLTAGFTVDTGPLIECTGRNQFGTWADERLARNSLIIQDFIDAGRVAEEI